MKTHKIFKIVGIAFLLIGALFVSIAYYFYFDTQRFQDRAISCEGVVVDFEKRIEASDGGAATYYYPIITYKAEDGETKQFISEIQMFPQPYKKGQEIEILIDKENPDDVRVKFFLFDYLFSFVMGAFGMLEILVGVILLIVGLVKGRKENWVEQGGKMILTDVDSCDNNRTYRVAGESPYNIITKWKDPESRLTHYFKSENIWYDPTKYVGKRQITVRIDPRKPSRYFMDLSFLPKN